MDTNSSEPKLDDFINWIDKLVKEFGVEIEIYAWSEIKKQLKENN